MSIVRQILVAALGVLLGAAPWLVVSFALAGLMHEFVRPERMQSELGNTGPLALVKATVSGMLLPICSCGVIPIGLGLYYSGAYLGPVLAFMTATPIINPAAVLLAYGLLGPQIATIYLVAGFIVPVFIGTVANRLAGSEISRVEAAVPVSELATQQGSLRERAIAGVRYGFSDLGVTVSKYVVIGAFFAGLVFALVPPSFIDTYLGDPGLLSLATITVLAMLMYVCAVGHIPFVAALVAVGASPGTAITFLMVGAATNLPELISITRLMGKRATALFAIPLVIAGVVVGWIANRLLGPGFTAMTDPSRDSGTVKVASWLIAVVPPWLQWACTAVVVCLAAWAYRGQARRFVQRVRASLA